MTPTLSALVALVAMLKVFGLGYYLGRRKGLSDCELSHDFDRCPHCGEPL